MKSFIKYLLVFTLMGSLLAACSNNKFKVKGEIYGAHEQSIVLEKSDFFGRWIPVDSTKINKNGGFAFSFPALSAPEIFRLALDNRYIYFPVDSTETITVNSSLENFGTDFSLTGSHNAERLAEFEKALHSFATSEPDSLADFKRSIYSNYMKDSPGSIVSFYILTKTIGGKPLYNPDDIKDSKYFAAVATGYKIAHPDDPRTSLLEKTALESLKRKNSAVGNYKTIEAQEIKLIDIDAQNENGDNVKLSDVAGKGKPVVVIFSLLNIPESPELNIALAEIYKRLGGKVEFFNVSLDADQYTWREAAKNLPWITVYSPGQNNSEDALHYNVFQVPSFFIYNAEGELSSRPMTIEELNKSL